VDGERRGYVKMYCKAGTGEILGCTIVGEVLQIIMISFLYICCFFFNMAGCWRNDWGGNFGNGNSN